VILTVASDVTSTFRFSSTGPWYVEIGSKPQFVRRESAEFILDWVRERKASLRAALVDAGQRDEAIFLIRRVQEQIGRSSRKPPREAIAEDRQALAVFEKLAEDARP
jgi:hypothetical protein